MQGPSTQWLRAFHEEFRLIGRSVLGRQVLERFLPLLQSGRLDIVEFAATGPAPELLQGSRSAGPGRPAGGFSVVRGRPTLWIQSGPALEIRAALLFHEMIHAVDDEFVASFEESARRWKQFRARAEADLRQTARLRGIREEEVTGEDLTPSARLALVRLRRLAESYDALRIYRAERRAYNGLYRWVQEVCDVVPGYRARLVKARDEGYVLDRAVSDEEIRRGYGLDPALIDSSAA